MQVKQPVTSRTYPSPTVRAGQMWRRTIKRYFLVEILPIVTILSSCGLDPKSPSDGRRVQLFPGSSPRSASSQALPNSGLTPGSIFQQITAADICVSGYAQRVRNVSLPEKIEVYRNYNLFYRRHSEYELDHLIPLELGGDNSPANLWPQSYSGFWNARIKDRLENELHSRVCRGVMPLAQVQHDFATNWVLAYQKYLGTPRL